MNTSITSQTFLLPYCSYYIIINIVIIMCVARTSNMTSINTLARYIAPLALGTLSLTETLNLSGWGETALRAGQSTDSQGLGQEQAFDVHTNQSESFFLYPLTLPRTQYASDAVTPGPGTGPLRIILQLRAPGNCSKALMLNHLPCSALPSPPKL